MTMATRALLHAHKSALRSRVVLKVPFQNAGTVAGGLKATLSNPGVSEEAKIDAQERLGALDAGAAVEDVQTGGANTGSGKNPGNVAGGLKSTINSEDPLPALLDSV